MVRLQADRQTAQLRSKPRLRRRGRAVSLDLASGQPALSVEQAREAILEEIAILCAERVPLPDALGRLLAEPLVAPFDIPPRDNTAMDGYAVRAADIAHASPERPTSLAVIEDLPAGYVAAASVGPGQAIRIMTGAPIPDGADAIAIVEHTTAEGDTVRISTPAAVGAHIRRRGEDVRGGETILLPGAELRAGEIGLMASIQRSFVQVWRRPTVAIVSTGDELVEVGDPLGPGKIVNSNSYALAALVREVGGVPVSLPIARDTRPAIRRALEEASAADFVVTTGGVSVGDYDFVKAVLDDLGATTKFWRVNMKPGKPVVFAVLRGKPLFGLPGNPVSSMVAFHLFVRPAIRKAMGVAVDRLMRPLVEAVLENDLKATGDRRTYLRARVRWADGALRAATKPAQGSGVLSSMRDANGLVVMRENAPGAQRGDRAPVQLIGDID
jgi:molybdopterin molybdotransferase